MSSVRPSARDSRLASPLPVRKGRTATQKPSVARVSPEGVRAPGEVWCGTALDEETGWAIVGSEVADELVDDVGLPPLRKFYSRDCAEIGAQVQQALQGGACLDQFSGLRGDRG